MSLRKALTVLRLTPRVCRLVWRITPGPISLLLLMRASNSLMPVAQLWLGKVLIDSIVAAIAGAPSAPGALFIFGVVSAHELLAMCSNAILQIQAYTQDYVGRRLSLFSDFLLRDKTLALDLAMIENPAFHDQYMRASAGAGARSVSLVNELMSVVESTITLVSLGAVFLAFKWPITVLLVITTVPNVYVLLKYSQKGYEVQRARTGDRRWAAYHASLLALPQSFKEVRVLQIGAHLLDHYKQFKWREFREDRLLLKKRQTAGFFSGAVALVAYYLAYVYVVYEALKGNITVGDMTFYSGGFARCQNAIKSLVSVIPNTHDINVYLTDFFDLLQAKPEQIKTSGSQPVSRPVRAVEFRHVSFRYPRSEQWVLQDINLTFRQGEKVGLVGENGAGKTTFVKLLCRLYDPTAQDDWHHLPGFRDLYG
jgi:ATP-binding cassette subfamily B protein